MAKTQRAASSVEDKLRRTASSHFTGTVKHGEATGPDPYVSDLRRKVARGEKFGEASKPLSTSSTSTKSKEKAPEKKSSGR